MEPDPVVKDLPLRRDEAEVTEYTVKRYVGNETIRVTVRHSDPGTSITGPRDRPFWTIAVKGQESSRWIHLPLKDDRGQEARDVAHAWANALEKEARLRKELRAAEQAVAEFMLAKREEGQVRLGLKPPSEVARDAAEERRRAENDRLNTPG